MTTHRGTAYLDGVRGWASLAVVVHHARECFLRASDAPWLHAVLRALGDGTMAVHVFFVLSGFVLSIRFIETGRWRGLAGLALRRYPRLTIPIAAISLIAFALMSFGGLFNAQAAAVLQPGNNLGELMQFEPLWQGLARFALFDVYFHYRFEQSYNTNLWTMPIEFIGSMLVFVFLAVAPRARWRRGLLVVALAVTLVRGSVYADFFLGVALAEGVAAQAFVRWPRARRIAVVSLAAVLAMALRATLPPWGWMLSIASTLIVMLPMVSERLRAALEAPLSHWLGRISFPLYLVHPLVIASPASWFAWQLVDAGTAPLPARCVAMAMTFVLSLLAARLFLPVEAWGIAAARRFSEGVLAAFDRRRVSAKTS